MSTSVYQHGGYAIRILFPNLVKGTQSCIEGLINEAYSMELIGSSMLAISCPPYNKATTFWTAIEGTVTTDHTGQSFKRLLTTLKRQPAITHLQTELEHLAQSGPGGKATDQPASRAFSGPHPGRSLSGQLPIPDFSGSSAATPPSKNTCANIGDCSDLSVDSGLWQEPDSTLSSNHNLSSTSEPEFMAVDNLQPVEHTSSFSQASEELIFTPELAENSSIEETGNGNHTLVTSSGQQLVPPPQSSSTTTLLSTVDEAVRSIRHDAYLKDAELSQTREELQIYLAKNNSLQQQLEQLKKEKDKEIQEKDEEIIQLRAKIEEGEQKIGRLERRIAKFETRIANIEKENEEVTEKYKEIVKSMEVQQTTSKRKIEALEVEYLSKLNELRQNQKEAEDQKKDAMLKHATLEAKLATERLQYVQKIGELKDIIADKNKREAELEVQLAQERQRRAELRADVESDKRRNAEIRAEEESDKRRRSEAHVKDLEKELASLRARHNEINTS